MRHVRGWVAGLLVLAAGVSAPAAFAEPITLDDVIRLNATGVADETIMSEVIVTESVFRLTTDEIIRLAEVGFSDNLILFLVDTGHGPDSGDSGAPTTYDDVLRLTEAGVTDPIIKSQVTVTESVLRLTPGEIAQLSEAGASEDLIQFLVDTGKAGGVDSEPVDLVLTAETSTDALTINDIIRLNAAGVADETIMAQVTVTESVFHLTPDDIIRLSEAGATDALIQFLIDTGYREGD
jgi:hypothetical protein